jgi:hypothetical protein
VATKQELAESMTVAQLKEFAANEGIDTTGLSAKDDLVERVSSSSTKEALQTEYDALYGDEPEGDEESDSETGDSASTPGTTPSVPAGDPSEGAVEAAPIVADDHRLIPGEDADLRPASEQEANAVATETDVAQPRVSPADTAGLAEAGQSPADLELRLPQLATGEPRIVKARPEMPTAEQVKDSTTVLNSGPPAVSLTVTDADGEERAAVVDPADSALLAQRAASQTSGHPAHTSKGHWSNPNLTEMTEEEKEEDAEAYAARVS